MMKKLMLICAAVLLIWTVAGRAGEQASPTEEVASTTDIHFTGKYCSECHEKTPRKGGNSYLKFNGDFTQLCRCHGYTPGTYIHPVDIIPSDEKKAKIPKEFPLPGGKVTCSTCHDIYMQCKSDRQTKTLNQRFLRGAPYISRTSLCFRCHDEKKYAQLNPHNQLTESGAIIVEKCLYCHKEKPDEKHQTFKDIKLIGNMDVLCFRCHYRQSKLHPINANHLKKPSEKILENMSLSERELGIILPLTADGTVTCATCHNPHDRGVLPYYKTSSQGAGGKYRLRLAGQHLEICVACHRDKFKGMQPGK